MDFNIQFFNYKNMSLNKNINLFSNFFLYCRLIAHLGFPLKRSSFRWHKNFLFSTVSNHIVYYGTPLNLTYAWSFGSLAGVCLVVQVVSGLFLAMFYTPHIDFAFASIEFIMRDVNNGWLVRYVHSNGASMFFLVIYCHIVRGLYYNSYAQPRELLWLSGTLLLFLMMATAFLGYVLPWGQMSFWGATVITSMFSAIPRAGPYVIEWLWGGFTVNNPTLNRFFTFHFFFPFVLAAAAFLHLILLHKEGSSAPLSDSTGVDKIPFYPYYSVKDIFAFFCFLVVFIGFLHGYPNLLGDPNNYVIADSIHTPRHIVPEWYFLPFYAILRSIPHKTAGILAMLFSLLVLFLLPIINTSLIKDTSSRLFFKVFYFIAIADFLLLGWLGQSPVKDGYIFAGQIATIYYFIFFLVLVPFSGVVESFWPYCRSVRLSIYTFLYVVFRGLFFLCAGLLIPKGSFLMPTYVFIAYAIYFGCDLVLRTSYGIDLNTFLFNFFISIVDWFYSPAPTINLDFPVIEQPPEVPVEKEKPHTHPNYTGWIMIGVFITATVYFFLLAHPPY